MSPTFRRKSSTAASLSLRSFIDNGSISSPQDSPRSATEEVTPTGGLSCMVLDTMQINVVFLNGNELGEYNQYFMRIESIFFKENFP